MKKSLYLAAMLLTTVFASCEKDEIGGTATESMAGQWYVTVDAVDDNGNPITETADGNPNPGEDYFGLGERVHILTYNTAANIADSMWINSNGNFNLTAYYGPGIPNYDFTIKVGIDQNSATFKCEEAANDAGDFPVTIEGGKILRNAGHQNNGSPADSIVFYVIYKGDPWYPDDGYAKYKVSGIRYSGLAENDD